MPKYGFHPESQKGIDRGDKRTWQEDPTPAEVFDNIKAIIVIVRSPG